jgi:predicted NBD/HSP70 family sugar kinase
MNYWDPELSKSITGLDLKQFTHKKKILKHLYQSGGSVPSTEICKLLALSTPTTLAYLNELVEEGFVENRGKGESIGGRKPNMFGLKKDSVFIAAVEITKHHINSAIYDQELHIVSDITISKHELASETTLEIISEQIESTIQNSNIDPKKIIGVGITMPGLVDSDLGINYTYLTNTKKPIAKFLKGKLNRQVVVENDATARTFAELRYGSAKECAHAIYVQLDWGVGSGLIFNGEVYRGTSGFASEFAHIPIDPKGKQCSCGKRGCLETLVSGDALVEEALLHKGEHEGSMIYTFCSDERAVLTPKVIIEFAKEGDLFALSLIHNIGLELGKGLAYMIQILNPQNIILSGRVAQAKEYLETAIQQSLIKYCIPKIRQDVNIVYSELGENSGLLGASTVIMERIFE